MTRLDPEVESFLNALHDATLSKVDLLWPVREVRLHLRVTPGESVMLVASGLHEFGCTRRDEWGESDSILEAQASRAETDWKLAIRMQSGDLVEIRCEDLIVRSS